MKIRALIVLATLTMNTGCASFATLGHCFDNCMYAGTRENSDVLSGRAGSGASILWPLALTDWPFSLAMDTVLLPVTLPMTIANKSTSSPEDVN
jgi:uncharacterized protein YceK